MGSPGPLGDPAGAGRQVHRAEQWLDHAQGETATPATEEGGTLTFVISCVGGPDAAAGKYVVGFVVGTWTGTSTGLHPDHGGVGRVRNGLTHVARR